MNTAAIVVIWTSNQIYQTSLEYALLVHCVFILDKTRVQVYAFGLEFRVGKPSVMYVAEFSVTWYLIFST